LSFAYDVILSVVEVRMKVGMYPAGVPELRENLLFG
jgi:hypothetical protein